MKIYVGNLSFDTTEDGLKEAFESFGPIDSVSIIKDKYSGRSKGFGFIEIADKAKAEEAINTLNGKELDGRTINVNEARPMTKDRPPRRDGGGFGGNKFGNNRRFR